jgi:hypothetical protein
MIGGAGEMRHRKRSGKRPADKHALNCHIFSSPHEN